MTAERFDTLFSLRYAVRVLERHARMWGRLDATLRVLAILSGTTAFGAIMAGSGFWVIALGVAFAFMQALEYGLGPARREQEARAARALYAELLGQEAGMSDQELAAGYQQAIARDSVIVPEALRLVAYNDVVNERGCDASALYSLNSWQRLIGTIA